jgi:regulator of sigma E protease
VNGKRIYSDMDMLEAAAANPGQPLALTVRRGEQTLQISLALNGAKIGAVAKDSPAEVAGLKKGDRVVGIDGTPQRISVGLSDYIRKSGGKPVELAIEREKFPQKIKVTPVPPVGEETPRLGIEWALDDSVIWDREGQRVLVHPSPGEQLYKSSRAMWDTLGAVLSSKSNIGMQHMGGPVMMMRVYYMMFESQDGWRLALWFSVLLNVNLALLNLLPIPVLDGGHITLAIVEGIRRRPVNVRILEYVQTACALLIIGFMVFILFFDVQDWIGGDKGPQMKFDRAAVAEAQKG